MIRKSMWVSIFAALLLLACSYTWVHFHMRAKPMAPKTMPIVSVFKLKSENFQPTIEAVGTLQANQGTVLKAQTNGQVDSIHFAPGARVTQGEILVTLNNVQQRGALDAAIAQQHLNKTMYQRDLELKKLGAISLAAVDQAKAALDAGEAAVHEAQGVYDLTIITAPFSGRVGIVKVNLGDYLQSGDSIVSLQNLDPMFIDFYVPEKSFSAIKKGETVNVVANTSPDEVFTGKIINYETVVDQTTGMLQVRAAVPNPQETLLPGGYATVKVDTGASQMTLTIPQTALMYDEKGAYVYLVQADVAIRQSVQVGEQINQSIQIISGLKPGDTIVSAGTNKVRNGARIEIATETGEA
ncbi:MAG: efflux RND transporter periplasmic adaptor subunit [Pseudomonadota bacterium]